MFAFLDFSFSLKCMLMKIQFRFLVVPSKALFFFVFLLFSFLDSEIKLHLSFYVLSQPPLSSLSQPNFLIINELQEVITIEMILNT